MNRRTAERLIGLIIAVVVCGIDAALALLLIFVAPSGLSILLLLEPLMIAGGVTLWALAREPLALRVLGRVIAQHELSSDLAKRPSTGHLGQFWYRLPRWALPAVGSALIALVFAMQIIGLLAKGTVLIVMAALAGASLILGLAIGETEDDDRRSDIPLAMVATWAALFVWETGQLALVLAVISWPVFMFGAGYIVLQGYPWRWIAAALPLQLLFNLVVFYAYWRPH